MDGGVEVGVVFGGYGLVEDRPGLGEHERGDEALLVGVAVGAGLDGDEEVCEALAESRPCGLATAHERVELGGSAGGLEVGGKSREEVVGLELVQVEDEGADAYAEMGRGVWRGREGAVWKRLQGETAGGLVGGADPAGGDGHGFEFRA